ncbi:MAG: cation transporter [Elusimicrobia bacterium]|nr:cation transporter [Elusimicrobiota bacterium]
MKENISAVGAVLSAVLASICCVGPLALGALGLGGVGFAIGLEKYRPYFRRETCADGSCKVGSGSSAAKGALWAIAFAVAGIASFPSWAPLLVRHAPPAAEANAETIKFAVSGMDCAACTLGIEKSLKKVPGVKDASIDFKKGEATVYAEKGRVAAQDLIQAIRSSGPYFAQMEKVN